MTTDTTTTAKCVVCRKDTDDDYGRVRRRPLLANDGATRYMCGGCYSSMPIENLRGYHWINRNAPTSPPTARPHGGRRVDVHVQGGCALCGVQVSDEWPEVIFELGGLHVRGPRCASCDGHVRAHDLDAGAYLVSVHGDQLQEDSFYAGLVLWHQREGLRPPPPADAPWQF